MTKYGVYVGECIVALRTDRKAAEQDKAALECIPQDRQFEQRMESRGSVTIREIEVGE
jgi:hypothetical protein